MHEGKCRPRVEEDLGSGFRSHFLPVLFGCVHGWNSRWQAGKDPGNVNLWGWKPVTQCHHPPDQVQTLVPHPPHSSLHSRLQHEPPEAGSLAWEEDAEPRGQCLGSQPWGGSLHGDRCRAEWPTLILTFLPHLGE